MRADLNDIFYKDPNSQEWKTYNSILEVTSGIESEERLLKVYRELQFLIALGNASYAGKQQGQNIITQGFYSSVYASFYLINNKQCRDRYELQSWKVDDQSNVFNFWHQLDDQNLKEIYTIVQPPIKVNHLIYIPMIDQVITILNVTDLKPVKYGERKNQLI